LILVAVKGVAYGELIVGRFSRWNSYGQPLLKVWHSSGANSVVDLSAFTGLSTSSTDFPPCFVDALAVRPMSKEDEQRSQKHRAKRTMR
jgi:hypothetical protein